MVGEIFHPFGEDLRNLQKKKKKKERKGKEKERKQESKKINSYT